MKIDLLRLFFQFWKKPFEAHNSLKRKNVIIIFMMIFPISFALTIVQVYFQVEVLQEQEFSLEHVALPTGFSLQSLIILAAYIGIAIVEEFAFRYWLKKSWLKSYFVFFTWLSVLLFGFLHATPKPWNLEMSQLIFVPFTVLSPMFGGFVLTFVRLQSNIKTSIIFHCVHNALGVIILITLGFILGTVGDGTVSLGI